MTAQASTAADTVAQQIADQFGDDRIRFRDANGAELVAVCRAAAVEVSEDDRNRYAFADGSVIVIANCAWTVWTPARGFIYGASSRRVRAR